MARFKKLIAILQSGCGPCNSYKTGCRDQLIMMLKNSGIVYDEVDVKIPEHVQRMKRLHSKWFDNIQNTPSFVVCIMDGDTELVVHQIRPQPVTANNIYQLTLGVN